MEFIQPTDENALGKLQDLAAKMSPEELIKFCNGMMNALIVVQDQFKKRFPVEYAAWEKEIEDAHD